MRRIASALVGMALLGCGTGETGSIDDAGAIAPRVELGTGTSTFVAVPLSGSTLELVAGPQGGFHVDVTLRLQGLDLERLALRYEVQRAVSGAPLADVRIVDDGRFVRDRDAFVRTGDFAQLDVTGPDEIVGDEIDVRVTVTARDGRSATDARRVTVVDDVR